MGYNGIRDYVTWFFNEFFQTERVEIKLREQLNDEVMSLLHLVSEIMTSEDRAEKILPIILENIKEDSDEEKRILGLELMDRLAFLLGKDIC